jgi:hypothetical protein
MASFLTESGVNPEGVPFVVIRPEVGQGWQLSPQEAREFALVILGAAEAALHDAAFVKWLQEGPLDLSMNQAAHVLGSQRQYRADLDE